MKRSLTLSVCALALTFSQSADAAPQSPINLWFCNSLQEPFNPEAAIKAFPLEKVAAVETSYDLPPKIYGETASFIVVTEGQFINGRSVTTLSVGVVTYRMAPPAPPRERQDEIAAQAAQWIREWGLPQPSKARPGFQGIEIEDPSGEEYFSILKSPRGSMIATWSSGGLPLARALCQ